jgi:cytochrome c biogenesis protein CcmG/thiol:disulfide interchange protein DsbE
VGSRRRTSKTLRILAFVVVPGLFVALLAFGLLTTTQPKAVAGTPAPDFELPLLGGEGTLSSEGLRGGPLVINVWASWCVPCREEAAGLERTWREYREKGVRFVGVNWNDLEPSADAFLEEFGITYPNVRDVEGKLTRLLGVRGVPETYFVDHRWRFFGLAQGDQIGARGSAKVLKAIPRRVLVSEIERMLSRQQAEGGR